MSNSIWLWAIGGLAIICGVYLLIKGISDRKKGISVPAELISFQQEGNATYPLYQFTYEGQEYRITSSVAVDNPGKYKHQIGDTVTVIFNPKNEKYVDEAGSYTDIIYAVISLALGLVVVIGKIVKG
ncbi:MAG: DUF3592 domain-containing protein [Saccharofermentans sp.]|nr:DUF3592 domain-containing protein [Saccharofermentans sp.]